MNIVSSIIARPLSKIHEAEQERLIQQKVLSFKF